MQGIEMVYLLLGLAVGGMAGGLVSWFVARASAKHEQGVLGERIAGLGRELDGVRASLAQREQELHEEKQTCGKAQRDVAGLQAQIESEQRATREKIDNLIAVEKSLKDSFEALAGKALDANSQRLLLLSSEKLERQQADANYELARKQTAIEEMLKPMQESLGRLSAHNQELEVKREGAYQQVLAEIKNIQVSHVDLRRETTQLVQALRAPKVRGNWGELQLRKCVEFAGMVQYASFDVERFVRGEEANYRPDLVVKMPNGRTIIVDAKTPLDAFLDASTAENEVARTAKLVAHAARVREHLKDLSSKAYWRQFVDSPDFIVCFLPSEVLFSAALEQDPSLIEYSASAGVLLATPTTLIALLKAVAFGWQQAEIAKNAQAIKATALAAYDKLTGLYGDFVDLGNRLRAAGESYDKMLTKAEGRGGMFSITRKLKGLGIGEKELAEPKTVAMSLKPLSAEDWQPGLALAAAEEE